MTGRIANIVSNVAGSVTAMFAVAVVPLLITAGGAIDYIRAERVQTALQAALDGAAMAAATSDAETLDGKIAAGENFFASNFSSAFQMEVRATIKISGARVIASAAFNYPTSILALGGIESIPIESSAVADMGKDGDAQFVMNLGG